MTRNAETIFLWILNYVGKDFVETKKDPKTIIVTLLVKVLVKVGVWSV